MSSLDRIWSEAARTLEGGKPFALATVINVRGSTPREVGAKMIVREDGQFGTIGGGCGEAEVFRKARLLLEEGAGARLAEVDLTGDFDQTEIGTCGGIMDVFIGLWSPASDLPMARELAEARRHNRPAALLTLVDPGERSEAPVGARAVMHLNDREPQALPVKLAPAALDQLAERVHQATPGLFEIEDESALKPVVRIEPSGAPRIFVDPLSGAQRLVIIGAGHIAQPLSALGSMLGFHTTVIDDRAAFANRERFPTADEIVVRPFAPAIDSLKLDRHCYVVVVTRGHAFDDEALRATLRQQARYVGMIGSRRRVKAMLTQMEEEGYDPQVLARVHAPIGLDIGAETPEEIAIAIAAEIVRDRRLGITDELSLGVKLGRLKVTT